MLAGRVTMLGTVLALGLATTAAPEPGRFVEGETQARRLLEPADAMALHEVDDPRLSPDGQQVAFTVETIDAAKDARQTDLYLVATAGGDPIQLTSTGASESQPRFSPDGRYLAFLSSRDGETSQLFLLDRRGGEARRLTELPGGVSDLAWSPDGRRLALVAHDPDPAAQAGSAEKTTAPPLVIRRLQFKRDGEGYLGEWRDHVYVVDVETQRAMQISFGPYDDSQPVWSPDGRFVVFVSNRTEEPDANINTDLFVARADGTGEAWPLTDWAGSDNSPAFSPDGRLLAYVAGGDPKDLWYGASHLAVIPFDPEARELPASRPLTATLDRNVLAPRFSADGKHVHFLLEDGGRQPLARVPSSGGPTERVVDGERVVSAYDLARDGTRVVLESSPHQPNEISVVAAGGELRRLTRFNDAFLAGIRLGPVERFEATSPDGTRVGAFLVRPPDATGSGPLPTILWIHGGPMSQYAAEFDFDHQVLAAAGYAVIAANPRGSTGYGSAFSLGIWQDWGNPDSEDVIAAVDELIARGVADPERLGVGGWSYGGILTNAVITKTTRFKAAVSGASEVNYLSNYGTDHYQHWWETELGLPWRNTELWLKLSPFFKVEAIQTPTLILCGQDDTNVPLLNSEQLYQALRRLGRETELIIYPGQNHGISKPSYVTDRYQRYLAWFDRYLRPEGATPIEATSLSGRPLARPAISAAAQERLEFALRAAQQEHEADPGNADKAIWYGRRLAYLARYAEAIETFSAAIEKHPGDQRLYRHRGHRYITTRQLDRAIADLDHAAQLSAGVPDSVEPDGAPNERGIPTSTSHFNVFYHLALAHYLQGDFDAAAAAWQRCLEFSKGSNDRLVATSDWLYLALRRARRESEAAAVLMPISAKLDVIEDQAYLDRLLFYRGEKTAADLIAASGPDGVGQATYRYAIGVTHLLAGRPERAREEFERIVAGPRWDAFGYIAAEAELARLAH